MTLANTNCKLPEDCVSTSKQVEVLFNINLQYLFFHTLVYNKQFISYFQRYRHIKIHNLYTVRNEVL